MDKQQNPLQENRHYESDTARLVRRHLSDPDHVFTEEELANVRIGSTPMPEASAGQAIEESEDHRANNREDSFPGA